MKKQVISGVLIASMVLTAPSSWYLGGCVQAANKVLDIKTARTAALGVSDNYTRIKNKLTLAETQYVQSVKKLKLKEKNQRSFRWSPLLNFKLPESPNLSEEFEYNYQPLELQSELDELEHELDDSVYGIHEAVELQFVEVYRLQEQIACYENQLESAQTTLKKNRARLLTGEASQTDVDSMESKVSSLEKTIASDKRTFEAGKEKLSTQTGLDLMNGYTFESPFVDADMNREILDELTEYTLQQSDTYYKAEKASSNALLALNTNYSLMENQYGSANMSLIDTYINQAKNGQKLDSAAFKLKYNELLKKIDDPWTGNFRILFISIPKEWLKGSIDGIRYVEDEPYALYEAAIEYQNALAEQESTKNEIIQNVKENFENYVSAKNACKTAEENISQKKTELTKNSYLNATGRMTYEEYAAVQEEYEELQIDYLQAQADYAQILYSFNALTCGRVSDYMTGSGVQLSIASGGQSYVVEDEGDGIYYYIRSLVSDSMFELGITMTEDMETEIDSYELWIDGIQVGEKTSIDQTIRHLTLDTRQAEKVVIRLYAGDEFLDDCEIDPTEYSGKLTVTNYHIEQRSSDETVAYYEISTMASGFTKMTITPKVDGITSYLIKDREGTALVSETPVAIGNSFQYLPAAANSLEDLTVTFYDADGNELYEGTFNSSDHMIYRKTE